MQLSVVKGFLGLSLLGLVGCGGSDGSEPAKPEPKIKISGKVIDGYVSGATVWLDINANGEMDDFEPSAVSGDAGDYSLELTTEQRSCLNYASLIVNVPVGAIDEDSGEVTEAYQMALPPRMQGAISLSNADIYSITPLTTVLAEQLRSDLKGVIDNPVSCNDLKNSANLREQVKEKLLDALSNTVTRYNLSTDTIFSDYIADDNQEAYSLAVSIVKGLQAGYAYKTQLEADYPDATYTRVEFAQYKHFHPDVNDDFEYKDDWFRDVAVWFESGFYSERVRVNDDLTQELGVFYRRHETDEPWGNGQLTSQWTGVKWGYDNQGSFTCSLAESVTIKQDGVEYSLSNAGASAYADTLEDCQPDSYSDGAYRYFGAAYNRGLVSFDSRFTLDKYAPAFSALADWKDLEDKAEQLSFDELIAFIETLPYRFDEPVAEGLFSSWYKRRTDDTGNRVLEFKRMNNNELEWYREVYQADDTYIKECTSDGVTWTGC